MMKIAYLAPEIPSLSGTFVYNEILGLEKQGFVIIPLSVHYPHSPAQEAAAQPLLARTYFIYQQGFKKLLTANFKQLLKNPKRYFSTLGLNLYDVFCIGLNINGLKCLYQFLQANLVASILQAEQCQHLHIHFAHVPTQIGMYAALLAHIPFTFTSHANDLFERGLILKNKALRAKKAITISEYNRRFLEKQGIPAEKIAIVRCGIDTENYEFKPDRPEKNTFLIGTLGRLVEKKGMDIFIEAIALLRENGVAVQAVVAGNGELLPHLQAQVKNLNLQAVITFTGALSHEAVMSWMQTLDMFVLACKPDRNGDQDGIPVVLMEAMAVGTPVISTSLSGIPELIEPNVGGLLAAPNDALSLAKHIEYLLSHIPQRRLFVETARRRIATEFDETVNIQRLISIFQEKI